MPKFNTRKNTPNAVNDAGGAAYALSNKVAFLTFMFSSFNNDTYYTSGSEQLNKVKALVDSLKNEPEFLAKATVFARNTHNMRSVTHFVSALMASNSLTSKQPWGPSFFEKVVVRPDDMMEILAAYKKLGGVKIPNAMKKGFANAFSKFNTEVLSKYTGEGREFKLVDVVNLVHPIPNDGNKVGLEALVRSKLKNMTTSSRVLSAIGQKTENEDEANSLRAEYFKKALEQRKLGYIDMIRNINNIVKVSDESTLKMLVDYIGNPNAIAASRIMPYQLFLAWQIVSSSGHANSEVLAAIANAISLSVSNVPEFSGKTAVVVDSSGSMSTPINNNRTASINITCYQAGQFMAAVLLEKNPQNTDVYHFSDNASKVVLSGKNIPEKINSIKNKSGGTNFESIFLALEKPYDRIIILTDQQGWLGRPFDSYSRYKKVHKCNPYIYMWNLAGTETCQLPEDKVIILAGYSNASFQTMRFAELDKNSIVDEVNKVIL